MNENPAASDWSAARGEKWCAHVAGMEGMLTPVDEPLIDALHLNAPCRIAELGCGGGGTTLEILRRAPPGSVVHGFDISPALIAAARARRGADEPAITFSLADVARAPAPAVPYDRLISRFGIMFYDDPPAAFANLVRWLAPGGRFAFAAWGPMAENPWLTRVREVVAGVIDLPSPEPDAPGPFRYAGADKLLTLLERAGFGDLEVCDWRDALAIGGGLPAAEAAHFALASSSVGELLAAAGDDVRSEARQALTARFSRYEQDGVVRLNACVHILTGARPAILTG